jgi:glycosyltransferase involved in cell wall biosynthesis
MNRGISICILTHNVFFYNRLAIDQIRKLTRVAEYEILVYDNASTDGSREWLEAQPDVILFKGPKNEMRHGPALDFLVRRAKYPICCCLCSDAFPVSPEWLTPAMYLDDKVYLSGIGRNQRGVTYVCPSYLFGWTQFLSRHTFVDNWPKWDTGEKLTIDCVQKGHTIKTWEKRSVEVGGGFKPAGCDYNGWVWHTWWGGRHQTVPNVIGMECQKGYHEHVENMLRKRFNLEY